MSLSLISIEQLLDLAENKLGALTVIDREDARELVELEVARDELLGIRSQRRNISQTGQVIQFPG